MFSRRKLTYWIATLVAIAVVASTGWYVWTGARMQQEQEAYLSKFKARLHILEIRKSDKGELPLIVFEFSGTTPVPPEEAELDLVNRENAHSVSVTAPFVFGRNEIDLNTATAGVPSGVYTFRLVYFVPGKSMAYTTAAAMSERFEIK